MVPYTYKVVMAEYGFGATKSRELLAAARKQLGLKDVYKKDFDLFFSQYNVRQCPTMSDGVRVSM